MFSTARASSVFLSSYRNTVLNQSACVFALGYFLDSDKTWIFDQSERAQSPIYVILLYGGECFTGN